MSAPLTILVIVLANVSLGWLVLKSLTRRHPLIVTLPEKLFISFTFGVCLTGWLAVVFAELGWFSIGLLGLFWLVMVLLTAVFTHYSKPVKNINQEQAIDNSPPELTLLHLNCVPNWVEYLLLGLWLIVAIWLFFRPHQYINGAADAGVYVNLGAEIAQNGSLVIQDDFLEGLSPELYPAFLRPLDNPIASAYIMPAFFVVGEPAGEITPQFYPLHPVWQAVAFSLAGDSEAGVQAELLLIGLWGLLGCLAIYFTVRQIAGWQTAVLALAGLSLNALQIWFSRYPVSESLSQYLLWTGLWSIGMWLKGQKAQPVWALLAGLTLGHFFLTRIDALFILPILGVLAIWLWLRAKPKPDFWWFMLPLALLVSHSLLHALTQSRPYFFDLFNFATRLLTVNWPLALGGLILGIIMLIIMAQFKGRFAYLERYQRPFTIVIIALLFLFAGYLWFIRANFDSLPAWQDPYSTGLIPQVNHENLVRLGWYLSPLGVWLGLIGIAYLIWRMNGQTAVLLAINFLYAGIYLWNIRANPHQIYAMRRYMPSVMPLFIMGGAIAISWLATHHKRWLQGIAYLLALAWLGSLAWSARGFITQVDHPNLFPQLAQLSSQFEDNAVLIFNDPAPISQGDIIGTPLRFIFGHDVLTLRDVTQLDTELFEQQMRQWEQEGKSIYWLTVPDGQTWPLTNWTVSPVNAYSIQTTALENVYVRKPTAVLSQTWQGQINRLIPKE